MIIVTGMHRSGTSAVSQLMRAWGVDFGPESSLLAADRWNERGYLESKRILDTNSRIVTGWPRSSGGLSALCSQLVYFTRPSRRAIDRRARRGVSALRDAAEEYRGRAVKDPRFCLTLRHWRAVHEPDSIVLCLRHPSDVADSLRRRQRVPVSSGLRFWKYHWEALLDQLDGVDAHWFRFDDLLADGRVEACRSLAEYLGLDLPVTALEAAVEEHFAERLVHRSPTRSDLPWEVRNLWEDLLRRAGAV